MRLLSLFITHTLIIISVTVQIRCTSEFSFRQQLPSFQNNCSSGHDRRKTRQHPVTRGYGISNMCPLSLPLLAAKKSLHIRFALKATRVTLTSVAAVAPKKSSATKKRKAIKKKKKTKKKISTGTTTRMTTINSKAKPKSPITKQKKKGRKEKEEAIKKKDSKKG